ncbi:TPA: coiled-coil domain-containing protein [Enterobacter ludwigii]
MSKIDTWFARIANLSQLGVLILAVFGYFYTVLPVYQKSLLDEEIAKKTLEIEKKDKQIAAINKKLEERASELESLSSEINKAKDDAAQAKTNLRTMQGKYSKQYSELRVHLLSQFINLAYSQCYEKSWEIQSLTNCFIKTSESAELRELNNNDIKKLKSSISLIAPKLISSYKEQKNELDSKLKSLSLEKDSIEKECEINKTKKEYEDRFEKINIDYDCIRKKSAADNKKIELEMRFIFAKEKLMSKALEDIANRTVN